MKKVINISLGSVVNRVKSHIWLGSVNSNISHHQWYSNENFDITVFANNQWHLPKKIKMKTMHRTDCMLF